MDEYERVKELLHTKNDKTRAVSPPGLDQSRWVVYNRNEVGVIGRVRSKVPLESGHWTPL